MKKILLLFIVIHSTVFAQNVLQVDLSNKFRSVTHCASGSLYGLTESLPTDMATMVAPLKPCVFANPAKSGSGHQQPIGDALKVSERLQNTTGKVQVRLADLLPGWPYRWPGLNNFLSQCSALIDAKKATGRTNYDGYEIWNEPYGTWKTENGTFEAGCWKPVYDLIRSKDPGARIIGPSFAYYNNARMRTFLTYCKANNCLPEVICWHQWGAGGFTNAYNTYRALEKELGISPREITINEYSSKTSDPYEGCPGYSVPFISKFERHGIESACISWWFTNLPGRLGSLLTANNQKGGGWHLYKWYGDMSGSMVKVTPPNDFSDGLDGFACVDESKNFASVCLGGKFTGNANVNISGFPSWFGNQVKVKLEYVTWTNKDTPVAGTNLISETVYTVNNGSISVPVNVTSEFYAYHIYLEPSNVTPIVQISNPLKDTVVVTPANVQLEAQLAEPSTISSVRFMVGGQQIGTTKYAAPYTVMFDITEAGVYEVTAIALDKNNKETVSQVRTIRTVVPQIGYNYKSHNIPGTIELEEYDFGGNDFAYFDNSPGSETDVTFRDDEDVDLENCTDEGAGYNIGYATAGEWLEYTINVLEEGIYDVDIRVACSGDGRTIDLSLDDKPLVADIAIPNTTGWQVWETVTLNELELSAGEHVLRLTIGAVDYVNLNYIKFTKIFVPEPPVITLNSPVDQFTINSEGTISFSATASDPDGNIIGVSFYEGDNLLTTVNTAPYVYEWSGMDPGVYTLSAEAFDTDGLSTKSDAVVVNVLGIRKPYTGSLLPIPGKIEAEAYDLGGEGVGFHEANTNGNQGGATLRNDEVDIEVCQDVNGGFNLGYILKGEWVEYSVVISESMFYNFDVRVAKDGDGGLMHIEIDGEDVTGAINVPNTGGWQTWETITLNDISLTAGEHIMRVVFDTDYSNLNYVEFKGIVTAENKFLETSVLLFPNPYTENVKLSLAGEFVYKITNTRGVVVEIGAGNNFETVGTGLASGVYLITISNDLGVTIQHLIKK